MIRAYISVHFLFDDLYHLCIKIFSLFGKFFLSVSRRLSRAFVKPSNEQC
jgi:hypothetical protein